MDLKKLEEHIKLCKRNLKSQRVKCCAGCPFEEEISNIYPDLKYLFQRKQDQLLFPFISSEEKIK